MTETPSLDAVKVAYDEVAVDYADLLRDSLASSPMDRAVLAVFSEQVVANGGSPVADLGCGPGRVTAHLHDLGLDVFGIDLSPAMIAVARASHPHLSFAEGSMAAVEMDDARLGGVVAWYSVIHTPPEHQPQLYAEFARLLCAGGHLVMAFQIGDECVHLDHAYGHAVSLDAYRLSPDRIDEQLAHAGFEVTARVIREPVPPEKPRQCYLLATRRSAR